MHKYKFKFSGNALGAIGKRATFTKTITADTLQHAWLQLYDSHENITIVSVNGKPYDYNKTTEAQDPFNK